MKYRNYTPFYISVFAVFATICIAFLISFNALREETPKGDSEDDMPAHFGECTTYIENENGSVRLTDTRGYSFDFKIELYRDFSDYGFEIKLYGNYENRLIISKTAQKDEYAPKIYVNGALCDALPTERGIYDVRLDVSHITERGFTVGNSLDVIGFGKIDLLCMY